jgi:phage terminase large subunit-like protein
VSASLLARAIAKAGGPEHLVEQLGADEVAELVRTWDAVARPDQFASTRRPKTLWLAGRGYGKNFALTGAVHRWVESGLYGRIAMVAPTGADCRDTLVEGPAGILAWAPRHRVPPEYNSSKRRVTFWNGARAFLFSAEEPARFRGPSFDAAACDELAAWKRLQETWDMLQFCVRLGTDPPWAIGTTPRPLPLIKELIKDPTVEVVSGTTYDNQINLAPAFIAEIRRKYEGTRLGLQEIHARILDDNPEALWRLADIEAARRDAAPDLRRVAVAVDPAVSAKQDSDQTGIISAGIGLCRCKKTGPAELHAFVLGDRTGTYKPRAWAEAVKAEFEERDADRVLAEVNQGGDLVEANLQANGWDHVPFTGVHATKGGKLRAEPVAALYEQGKVHHVGNFASLEDHLTQWNPVEDPHCPDDVTALVYVLTELMLGEKAPSYTRRRGPTVPRRM